MAWFDASSSRSSRHTSSSSYYRRRPRDGYIQRIISQIKRIVRDIYGYARRHPMKVFMLVVMPLITGGALHNILRKFGIRLPAGMFGAMGGSVGRNEFGDSYSTSGGRGGLSDLAGGASIQSIMKIAQMFL